MTRAVSGMDLHEICINLSAGYILNITASLFSDSLPDMENSLLKAFTFKKVTSMDTKSHQLEASTQTETNMKSVGKDHSKRILLGFSHELRHLLHNIMGNLQLSLEENSEISAEEFVKKAHLCTELLLHLVNNILDSGKAYIGELELHKTEVKVGETLRSIWSLCQAMIKEK